MADTNETIADIIAEMRRGTRLPGFWHSCDLNKILQYHADRLEAAYKREIEAIRPKSDPDWKDICAKCMEGEIEPHHCEYYGEPNGCNSPIYGSHPTAEKSSAVGDATKLREALVESRKAIEAIGGYWSTKTLPIIDAALAAPPHNRDRAEYTTLNEVVLVWNNDEDWIPTPPAKHKKGDSDGNE